MVGFIQKLAQIVLRLLIRGFPFSVSFDVSRNAVFLRLAVYIVFLGVICISVFSTIRFIET